MPSDNRTGEIPGVALHSLALAWTEREERGFKMLADGDLRVSWRFEGVDTFMGGISIDSKVGNKRLIILRVR